MGQYYEQLIGAKIIQFELVEDEYALDPFPVYIVKLEDGTHMQVDVSRDEEGNGGGFLFITPSESDE